MIQKHDEHDEGQRCTLSALGDAPLDPGGFCDMTAPQACRASSTGMTAAASSLSNAPLQLSEGNTDCLPQTTAPACPECQALAKPGHIRELSVCPPALWLQPPWREAAWLLGTCQSREGTLQLRSICFIQL